MGYDIDIVGYNIDIVGYNIDIMGYNIDIVGYFLLIWDKLVILIDIKIIWYSMMESCDMGSSWDQQPLINDHSSRQREEHRRTGGVGWNHMI